VRGQVTSRTLKRTGARVWDVTIELARDPQGKRRRLVRRGFRTRREAEAKVREVLGSLDRGSFVEPSRETTAQYLTTWELGLGGLKASTIASYQSHARRYLIPLLGYVPLQRLAPEHVRALITTLGERGLSPATVRRVHATLHKSLADAVDDGKVARNAADLGRGRLPRVERHEIQPWSADELRAFLAHVETHRLSAAFWVLAATGCRRGELLGLRWEDIDLEAGKLSIRQSLVVINNVPRFESPKNDRGRALRLDAEAIAVLKAHRTRQKKERIAWEGAWVDNGLVFTREDGELMHPTKFNRLFGKLTTDAGLRHVRVHDLRHGFATMALTAGINPKVVQQRLGHSSISVTMDIYSHVLDELDEQAASVLSRAVGQQP
jgi:integrase